MDKETKLDYLDLLSTSNNVYWDEDKYTFDEFQNIIMEAIEKTVKTYTINNQFIVDDWDMFDSDLVHITNQLLGNDED